jgi:hypothetical protein
MAWNLRAQLIETCSCNMFCPCWYGARELMVMDRGWCTTTQWYLIENGRSADVDLSGRTVVLTMDFPGPTLFDGNGTGRLYIDDGASADQRRELEAIFQGKKGGAVQLFGSIVANWLPTKAGSVALDEQDNKTTARIAGVGQVESTLLKDESGRVMTAQNLGFASFFNSDGLSTELAPSTSQWSDGDLPHPLEHRSGARSTVNWRAD